MAATARQLARTGQLGARQQHTIARHLTMAQQRNRRGDLPRLKDVAALDSLHAG